MNSSPVCIRPEYLAICNGDHCAAAILNNLEYRTSDKLKAGLSTWIYKKQSELQKELWDLFGLNKIAATLKWLGSVGFLTIRNNPRNTQDRTLQYCFEWEFITQSVHSVDPMFQSFQAVWLKVQSLELKSQPLGQAIESESLIPESKSESIPESRIISSTGERDFDPAGSDDKNISDGEYQPLDDVPEGLRRKLPTATQRKQLAEQTQRLGVTQYGQVLKRCYQAHSWEYVLKSMGNENPTPLPPAPSDVSADWLARLKADPFASFYDNADEILGSGLDVSAGDTQPDFNTEATPEVDFALDGAS